MLREATTTRCPAVRNCRTSSALMPWLPPMTAIRIGSSHERCLTNRAPRCVVALLQLRWVLSSALAIAALSPLRCSRFFGADSAGAALYCVMVADAISD